MSSIRIIGVGSPSGDCAGLLAIDRLEQMELQLNFPKHQIILEKLDHPGPALLSSIQNADLAIVIDTLICSHAPGEVVPLTPDAVTQDEWVLSENSLGVAETIALGRVLGELPDSLLLLGIAVDQDSSISSDNVDISSATVESILRHITKHIEQVE